MQEAIREEAERMAALNTMRQMDWDASLAKLKDFKKSILEPRQQGITAPKLSSPRDNRKSLLISVVGHKSMRGLSFAAPQTPTLAHTAGSPYGGAMREVQDEILGSPDTPQDTQANGVPSSLVPSSPIHMHLGHIASAA